MQALETKVFSYNYRWYLYIVKYLLLTTKISLNDAGFQNPSDSIGLMKPFPR